MKILAIIAYINKIHLMNLMNFQIFHRIENIIWNYKWTEESRKNEVCVINLENNNIINEIKITKKFNEETKQKIDWLLAMMIRF